ncbi:4-hydroxy-2-oxoheptanedioate aldolase [Desulfomarina sp.]
MKLKTNPFKKALKNSEVLYGFWLGLASGYSAEICAGAGFDWLLIDGEHAPNTLDTILHQLQVVAGSPAEAVVRPVEGTNANIKQLLDIGAENLLIPMIESAEQAKAMVAACRYPPRGVRGVGTALARAADWNRTTDYLQRADDEICLLLQVESQKGLDALDDILAIEGVDGVFIGPADLAADLGYLGRPGHPEVKKVISGALARIRAADKAPGILATDQSLAEHYKNCGAQFIAVGVDTILLANATASLAARFKNDDRTPAPPSNGAY